MKQQAGSYNSGEQLKVNEKKNCNALQNTYLMKKLFALFVHFLVSDGIKIIYGKHPSKYLRRGVAYCWALNCPNTLLFVNSLRPSN